MKLEESVGIEVIVALINRCIEQEEEIKGLEEEVKWYKGFIEGEEV